MTNQTIHPCPETTGRKRKYEFVAHPDGTHGYTILIPETACDGELHALEKLAIAQRDRIAELDKRLAPDPRVAELITFVTVLLDLATDAVSGLTYVQDVHGDLYGVGFERIKIKSEVLPVIRLKFAQLIAAQRGEVEK